MIRRLALLALVGALLAPASAQAIAPVDAVKRYAAEYAAADAEISFRSCDRRGNIAACSWRETSTTTETLETPAGSSAVELTWTFAWRARAIRRADGCARVELVNGTRPRARVYC